MKTSLISLAAITIILLSRLVGVDYSEYFFPTWHAYHLKTKHSKHEKSECKFKQNCG